jgi:hypothetical protein
MIDIRRNTDPIPGSAVINPSTTRLSDGTTERMRRTLRMRSARSTDRPCPPGTRAMPTMTKSNRFQPERKNRPPSATSFNAISTTKIARQARSSARISGPAVAISVSDVSMPRMIALNTITPMIVLRTGALSSHAARRWRTPTGAVVSDMDDPSRVTRRYGRA